MPTVISVENLAKVYHLGQIGSGTFANDLKVWFARLRGKPNPLLRVGDTDYGNRAGEEIWALRDVTFSVEQGDVLGIIGRNGAGKSTILKILSRVTAPTRGMVKVKGRIASLLEVGTGFHPELTGKENIYLNGSILGMNRAEVKRKLDEIVEFAEVSKFLDTPVKRYSSGMYVRLAFAVAAHLDPEIMVVDEVLAVGDAEFQNKCLGKMGDVARDGRTVLFVSHNMASIRKLCPRSVLMDKGTLKAMGATDEVINDYLSGMQRYSTSSLEARTDREGNGRMRFTHFEVAEGSPSPDSIILGASTRLNLHYKGTDLLKNVHVSLAFYNSSGDRLFWISNDTSGRVFREIPSCGIISVFLERFPLVPGHYSINLYCEVDKKRADWIQSAAQVVVHPGDFYGNGTIPPNGSGPLLVPNQWDFRESGEIV
jgi:lipopolysaccharide transport system ATP-binding protein